VAIHLEPKEEKRMKRLLSLILALCLMVGMLPAVSAEVGTEGKSGITVTYSFMSGPGYSFAAGVDAKTVKYNDTNGFWQFRARDTLYATWGTNFRSMSAGNSIEVGTRNNGWFAIEIDVPKAGTYNISLSNVLYSKEAAVAGLWILPATTENAAIDALLTEDTMFGNQFDFHLEDVGGMASGSEIVPLGEYYFSQGKHLIVYKSIGTKKPGNTEVLLGAAGSMYISGITLNGGDGEALMSVSASLDKEIIDIGQKAQLSVKGIMSNHSESNITDYSATITPEDIASIDDNGVITALKRGNASINVSASDNGRDFEASIDLLVAEDGARIFYNVGTLSSAETSTDAYAYLKAPTYEKTNDFYKFYGTNVDMSEAGTVIRKRTKSLQLTENRAAVYEVYIPMAGDYRMEMYNSVFSRSDVTEIDVYLGTDAKIKENGGIYQSEDSGDEDKIVASFGKYIGSYGCSKDGENDVSGVFTKIVTEPNIVEGFVIPEAGYYTLAFYADGGYGSVGDFYLVSGSEKIVPMKVDFTGFDTGYVGTEVIMSDGNMLDLSNATIKYYSSNPAVASIGEDDGIIDVYALGETEITVEISKNGEIIVEKGAFKKKYTVMELPPEIPCAETVVRYNFRQVSKEWKPTTTPGQGFGDAKRDDDVTGITFAYTNNIWEWFGSGPNNRKAIPAIVYDTRLKLDPGKGNWDGLTFKVAKAGRYAVNLEYYTNNYPAADADIYIIPKPATVSDADKLINRRNFVGYLDFLDETKTAWTPVEDAIGVVEFPEPREYVIIFKTAEREGAMSPRELILDGINNLKLVEFTAEKTDIVYNESVNTSLTAMLLDETVLDKEDYTVKYESSDTTRVTVDKNGVVTGKGHGKATITATVESAGAVVKKSIEFNTVDNTDIVEKEIVIDDFLYVGEKAQISLLLTMESGNKIVVPREDVTFTSSNSEALSFAEVGYVSALKEAHGVTIYANGSFLGKEVNEEATIDIILHDGKKKATYYTENKRNAAVTNAERYDWAKNAKKTAQKAADAYLDTYTELYEIIPAEGLPRSRQMGVPEDPYYNACRYCNEIIENNWIVNPIAQPWKIQCPNCKRLFPSNEFDEFYKLGLDKQGGFDRIRAYENHRAMLIDNGEILGEVEPNEDRKAAIRKGKPLTVAEKDYYGYGKGYLKNVLYAALDGSASTTVNNGSGMRAGEDVSTWGVDDGWGYIPTDDNGNAYEFVLANADGTTKKLLEKHCYIAIYMYKVWPQIISVCETLRDAYLYTGDIKYGRVGAILMDRVADVYHTYDLYMHNNPDRLWMTTDGGGVGVGIIQGQINDNEIAQSIVLCADAFYPALTDTKVIDYLSEKAKAYGYDEFEGTYSYDTTISVKNDKSSSHEIWRNWENGIIRKVYWAVKNGRIVGNFGQRQNTTSISAIVQSREPETTQMLEWLFRPATPDTTFEKGGGGVTSQLIDVVDRDGMGHEASLNYNKTQIEGLGKMADYLTMYEGKKNLSLYNNPKFRQMFVAFTRPVTPMGHPQIGDAGAVLYHGQWFGNFEIWKNGFKVLKDTEIGPELAQYIWRRNGRTAEGLHYDIFTENPESFEADIMQYVDETGHMESDLLAGYGLAILRDGGYYESAAQSTHTDNQRDFWIYSGVNNGHGHADALNLGIEAFGLNLGADLGYPENTGTNPNRLQWISQSISHNTVIVNEKSQPGDTVRGFPKHFDDAGLVKVMDIDASHKYGETKNYRRSLVMVKIDDDTSYGVDFFRVTGGKKHTYSFHTSSSKVNEVSGLSMATEPEMIRIDENGTMDWATYAGKDATYVKNSETGAIRRKIDGETVVAPEIEVPVTFGQDPWTIDEWSYETMFPKGYTWFRNVRRAKTPTKNFTVDFEITDYHNVLKDNRNLHLRFTQLNDTAPNSVAFAGGYVQNTGGSVKRIGYVDEIDSNRAKMLEYILIERDAEEGQELDSLFTTVYEPYRGSSNIGSIETVNTSILVGTENEDDVVRAVKVTHADGERTDYIVYATNNTVKYNIGGIFDFQGFVGVYSINRNGTPIYRYVNDGNVIGGNVDAEASFYGTVEGFERNLVNNNYIDVSTDAAANRLVGKYIIVKNDGQQNAVYKIEDASALENHTYGQDKKVVRLDLGGITLIRGHQKAAEPELGYTYNIQEGQDVIIPLSYSEDFSPEFDDVNGDITTSAGSSISINISAYSPIETNTPTITYIGRTLPRGASIDVDTGVFAWKPTSSQVGENHVAITARDSDGRESTIHFTVTVYGSTTGGSSSNQTNQPESENKTDSPSTDNTDAPQGGGGGGGATPIETPDKTDDSSNSGTDDDINITTSGKFTDLGNYVWASDAINALATDGIIQGTSKSTFSPANNITRADFAILLVRAFKLTSDNEENFGDVNASDYFASELAIARNTGIVGGIGDNKYAPRNTITRQDMMVIVYRALLKLGIELQSGDIAYSDYSEVSDYAKEAVRALVVSGLVNGKSNMLAPNDYTTRAEVAVLVKRILDFTNKQTEVK